MESPVEATYWIVTVDYHYMGFDLYKRGGRSELNPYLPASVFSDTAFAVLVTMNARVSEEAILDSLRLPLLFQEFDSSAERVTVRILESLARFENIGHLSTGVVSSILVNQALRQEIASLSQTLRNKSVRCAER